MGRAQGNQPRKMRPAAEEGARTLSRARGCRGRPRTAGSDSGTNYSILFWNSLYSTALLGLPTRLPP